MGRNATGKGKGLKQSALKILPYYKKNDRKGDRKMVQE